MHVRRLVARPGIRDEGARGGKFMKSAVSVAGNHYKERSRCVETFVREMGGRNPLVTADPLDAEMKRR